MTNPDPTPGARTALRILLAGERLSSRVIVSSGNVPHLGLVASINARALAAAGLAELSGEAPQRIAVLTEKGRDIAKSLAATGATR